MGKYNTKAKATVVAPSTINEMGEKAYFLSAKEEFVSTILTTFLHNGYYEKERDIVNRIIQSANQCDPLFVAKAAIYARRDANMRSVTHLLAGELAERVSGTSWGKSFYRKVINRPDDMSEILGYLKNRNNTNNIKFKITNPIKRAFKSYLESMDAYLIDKYKMNKKEFSLKGLLKLFHPKATDKNGKAFYNLMNDLPLDDLYSTKIMEKELSKAGQIAKEQSLSKEDTDALRTEAISTITSNTNSPVMNILRNMRNILETGDSKSIDDAIGILTNKDKILHSKLLPFRFASAYEEMSKLIVVEKGIKFEKSVHPAKEYVVNKVLKAIEQALMYSVNNIPKLPGNTAILVDHSGSVRGDSGGSGTISAFSKVTKAAIGNLFGSMMVYSQKNCYLGLFGDSLIDVSINRNEGILEHNKRSFDLGAKCGPGTETGIYDFLRQCVANKTIVNNLIIFSDMVIGTKDEVGWYTIRGEKGKDFQDLFAKFRAVNPGCNVICVDVSQTSGKSVFHKSMRLTQIAGWSDKIFDIINTSVKGYDAIIKEIENIRI